MTIPELVKRRWHFWPSWYDATQTWYVSVDKAAWGISKTFDAADWDDAHEMARAWATDEELAVNAPDTIRAPAMGAAE